MNQDRVKRLMIAIFGFEETVEFSPGIEDALDAALDTLKQATYTRAKDQRTILELRFGLLDGKPQSLSEVAKTYGVTRQRIQQIEAKALRRLRHPSRSTALNRFVPRAGDCPK